jgi:hypothetical protein
MAKIQEVMEGTTKCFEAKHGLCNERLNIRKKLEDSHAPNRL